MSQTETLSPDRLKRVKSAYSTARIDLAEATQLLVGPDVRPVAGDLVLARVLQIGHHTKLETRVSRRAQLFVEDEILVCYGNRYAPDQFEAEVPGSLEECDLVAAGGVASKVISRHNATRRATKIAPIGLVADAAGKALNLRRYALQDNDVPKSAAVIAVLGSSMNAGKTTTAACLVRGLTLGGHKVAAAKVTGTGAGGDIGLMADAGARFAMDFTAAGVPSTYKLPFEEVQRVFTTLTSAAMAAGADVVVLEVADGVYQRETAWLAKSDVFEEKVDGVLFAVRDAMAAAAAKEWMIDRDLPTPLALSGAIALAPLAMQEAEEATGLKVIAPDDLMDPKVAETLLGRVAARLAA